MTLSIKLTIRDAMLDMLATALDAGSGAAKIAVYDGTRPTNVDTALSGNTKLVEFTTADPSCVSAAAGVLALDNSPALSATAVASGTASFFRAVDSAGVVVMDGSVGTSGADLLVSSTSITSGEVVTVTTGNVAQLGG